MLGFLVVNLGPGGFLKILGPRLAGRKTSLPRSHFIGCGWYAIGMEDFSPEDMSGWNHLQRGYTARSWSSLQKMVAGR